MNDHVSDYYQRSNWVICDFTACNIITFHSLRRTFCLHLCGLRCDVYMQSDKITVLDKKVAAISNVRHLAEF